MHLVERHICWFHYTSYFSVQSWWRLDFLKVSVGKTRTFLKRQRHNFKVLNYNVFISFQVIFYVYSILITLCCKMLLYGWKTCNTASLNIYILLKLKLCCGAVTAHPTCKEVFCFLSQTIGIWWKNLFVCVYIQNSQNKQLLQERLLSSPPCPWLSCGHMSTQLSSPWLCPTGPDWNSV